MQVHCAGKRKIFQKSASGYGRTKEQKVPSSRICLSRLEAHVPLHTVEWTIPGSSTTSTSRLGRTYHNHCLDKSEVNCLLTILIEQGRGGHAHFDSRGLLFTQHPKAMEETVFGVLHCKVKIFFPYLIS